MTTADTQDKLLTKKQYFTLQSLDRATLRHRLPAGLVLIYYVWILIFAWSTSIFWYWNFEEGLMWTHGGPGMFFPIPMGGGIATVITSATIIDQIFYLVFMHNGIWILWILLGFLYIFSPFRFNIGVIKEKITTSSMDGD